MHAYRIVVMLRVPAPRGRHGAPGPPCYIRSVSGHRPFADVARRSGVALLLVALVLPGLVVWLGEAPRAQGPEHTVLVAPDAMAEMPSDCDGASAPLLQLLPAGIVGTLLELPAPASAPLATREADRLPGDATLSWLAPPPRRA